MSDRAGEPSKTSLTGKSVFSIAIILRCLLVLMAPGSAVLPTIHKLAIVGAREFPPAIGTGEHRVVRPLREFELPDSIDNRGHLRHDRGALVDEHELLEQDALQEGFAGQSEGADGFIGFGGYDPGAEPLYVYGRHWATTTHPEDKDDRSVGEGNSAPAVVDRNHSLSDHLELSRGEPELQVDPRAENRNGVDDMVAVPDESLQVNLDEFPDSDLLFDLNAIRVVVEAVEGAELGNALGVCKKGQLRKIAGCRWY